MKTLEIELDIKPWTLEELENPRRKSIERHVTYIPSTEHCAAVPSE
jgi:hypothetical protein